MIIIRNENIYIGYYLPTISLFIYKGLTYENEAVIPITNVG